MFKRYFIFLAFFPGILHAQSSNETLVRDFNSLYEKYFNKAKCNVHTSIRPLLSSEVEPYRDSVKEQYQLRWLTKHDTGKVAQNDIGVDPILMAIPAYDLDGGKTVLELAGGIHTFGKYKRKLAWNFNFLSGKSTFANYIDSSAKYYHLIPEIGRAYGTSPNYNYQYYSGYVSYSPSKVFNFQVGKDKHFWGDGYRSLFLSDVSNSYPFAKITANVWHLKYAVLYAIHKDITSNTGLKNDDATKFGVFHYLDWNISKMINVGLFESVVWQGNDTTRNRNYDVNYLNPVLFFRPVEYSLGSADNSLIGGAFKIKASDRQQIYGQLIVDEFYLKEIVKFSGWWANKQGIQLGFKDFDLFTLKNLNFQMELNAVRPYTYSHGSVQQNYGHYGQPLAHPLGANFREAIGIINYRYKNWLVELKGTTATYGADSLNGKSWGHDIFESYIDRDHDKKNYTTQGIKTYVKTAGVRVAYLIDHAMNAELELGWMTRSESSSIFSLNTSIVFFGIKTGIWNSYRDY